MRSLLFVPADDVKKQKKALDSNADAIILDMEDSVSFANKAQARIVVREFFEAKTTSKPIVVRINALDSGFWRDDMAAILDLLPDYILIPKTRDGGDVAVISQLIGKRDIKIIALVTETASAMLNMASFKECAKNLAALTWGAEDLSAEIGAQNNKDEEGQYFPLYQMARSFCLLGATNAGVLAIDSVFTNFKDNIGLKAEATRAKIEGFSGKMVIHPNQIDIVNAAFTASDAQIAHAKRVIAAIESSEAGGVAQLDGEMIDLPHYKRTKNLINNHKSK